MDKCDGCDVLLDGRITQGRSLGLARLCEVCYEEQLALAEQRQGDGLGFTLLVLAGVLSSWGVAYAIVHVGTARGWW